MVDEKLDQDLLLCIARARANGSTGAELGVVDERAATEIEQLATPASQRDGNADDREEAGEFNVLKVVELRLRQQEQTASVNNREHPKAAVAPPDSLPVTASSPKGNLLHSLEQNNSNTVNQAQEAVTPTNPPTRQLDISKRYMLHPGAYAQDGPGVDSNADVNEEHTTAEATMNAPDTNNGLAVANIVEDGDLPTALPHNAGSDDSAAENRKKEHTNQIKSNVLFGVILLVICILILVSVLVSIKRKELDVAPTAAPTGNPSSSPTHAPTSLVDSVVSLFPAETIIKVFDDPSSPQSKAFDWLLEDTLNLPDLTVERIKQKFILATLFFATEGTNWAANDDWLSYDIHECSWFNKPDFAQYSTMGSLYPGYLKEFFVSSEPTPSICDNNGLYRHLWLDANNLGGTLPEELFLLTTLRTLSLGYNQVEGSIPSQVGQLVELEGLFLNSMKSVGTTIPTEIGLLTKLKAIGLHDNHHSGSIPSELWELSALDTLLALRNPMLKGSIPTEIGGMTKMRFMDLNDCDLTGSIPSEIGRVSLLEWVVGYGNRLTGTLPKGQSLPG
ncbi:Leucine Rich Repeat [Seminavis robusta]|uniref:Leucine Rich Repeat n=1 Tax=Seminavis robusta TaxID=568900 RepID=A0A9N8HCM4_9STRA|nr:Leucine Rich Repeat [Seminavis robusta]|eukprot:Sro417_g138820.1 Leucine Rich Repeat (561) ;mRNA; r:66045-67861